jgi:hypothetical protein
VTTWKQGTTSAVSRHYEPAPDDCVRAVELLLKGHVKHKADGVGHTVGDDLTEGEFQNASKTRPWPH